MVLHLNCQMNHLMTSLIEIINLDTKKKKTYKNMQEKLFRN